MADDHVLQTKLFNFICGSGGFVDLTVLLKSSSPLGSRKSEESAKKWLESRQGSRAGFACVKDQNGEIVGVRVDLRKKICYRYATKGICRFRRKQGNCKYWHICKTFVEGRCDDFCELSHDFYSDDNWEIAEDLDLPEYKYSNGAMKKIVSWSLPQVCELYQRNECTWSQCPYIHVCAQFIEESSHSNCVLSHDLEDSHNFMILEKYDLVPSSQVINIDFVRSNVLILEEQKRFNTAVVSFDPVSEQNQPSSLFPEVQEEIDQAKNARVAQVLFEILCKEFNCSAPLKVLEKRRDVDVRRIRKFSLFLEENNGKFLFTQNALGDISQVIAFCPKLRLCLDFVSKNKCSNKNCSYFHLCRKFIAGSCSHGENCSRGHKFRNTRDQETLLELKLGWLTNEQLRQLMRSSTPQVCISYNQGKCRNDDGTCFRVHICKDFVVNACRSEDNCRLRHKGAFDTIHTKTLLEKYQLGKTSLNNVWSRILICEEQPVDELLNRKMPRAASINCLPTESSSETTGSKSNMLITSTAVDLQTSLSSSQTQRVSEFKPSVPWTPCFPTEWRVFECLCKEYGSSASIQNIAGRKDLFPHGVESAERWFRETTRGSFLITTGSQGAITEVNAFSAKARICVSYNKNGRCHRSDCSFLHICRDFAIDSCSNGVTCPLNHHFHNQRDEAFLTRIKLDQFTEQQLQQLVLSSTPRICVEYNNGVCNRGDNCNRIHMCCGHIRKCCSGMEECGLDHEEAMDTKHTQAVLESYLLHKVCKHEAITMILDDKLCLSGKEKAKGKHLF